MEVPGYGLTVVAEGAQSQEPMKSKLPFLKQL
jgi:hypothetical protein